jgi:hypothetical protein
MAMVEGRLACGESAANQIEVSGDDSTGSSCPLLGDHYEPQALIIDEYRHTIGSNG